MPSKFTKQKLLDRLGMFASLLCLSHCMVCAFFPILVGSLGLSSLLGHQTEWHLTLLVVGIGLASLFFWRKEKASRSSSAFILTGSIGLLAGRILEEKMGSVGVFIGVMSGMAILFGHWSNLKLLNLCKRKNAA